MRDPDLHAEPAGAQQELQPDRDSKGLNAREWAQLADSGATTYTVGQPANWIGAFTDTVRGRSARGRAQRDLCPVDRAHRPPSRSPLLVDNAKAHLARPSRRRTSSAGT